MGMSASQVRFLSLQHRKNDIGRELTTLSNRKMGLSRDMNRVSKNYTDALNKTVLRWSNDAGRSYNVMNYDMLMKPNDLNCETPYIVTDSQGRVVVDDTKVWFDKENCKLLTGSDVPAGKGVTYRELAAAISAYSGVDSKAGNQLTFLNQSGLGIDSHTLGSFQHDTYTTTAVFGSSSKDGCQYEVVKGIKDYDFENTIRYDLMTQLGILTETESTQFNDLLDELYGTQNGLDFEGGYEALLAKFDDDHNYLVAGVDGYDKFFGTLQVGTDGNLSLGDTGCAMGNLALAKAYQEEYRAYLNTEIRHNVNSDRTGWDDSDIIVEKSTASGIGTMDNGNTHVVAKYKYDKKSESGISNRIVGLLTFVKGEDGKVSSQGYDGGTQYRMTVTGILNRLDFKNSEKTFSSFYDAFANGGTGEYNVYASTRGEDPTWGHKDDYWTTNNGLTGHGMGEITKWGQLYSSVGGEFNNDNKVSITGYTWGENRPDGNDISQIWDALEVSNNLVKHDNAGIHTHSGDQGHTSAGGWFELLRDSFKSIKGANEDAIDYAYNKMCSLYCDGVNDSTEESDGSNSGYKTRRRAASESRNNFGVGWCNEYGTSDDGVAINATNAIAAFVTFYEMYMRANSDPNIKINEGDAATKIYSADVNKSLNLFDTYLAKQVAAETNIVASEFDTWKKACDKLKSTTGITMDSSQPTITPANSSNTTTAQNITYSYTYTKTTTQEDGSTKTYNITETATVHGIWNGTGISDGDSIDSFELYESTSGPDGSSNTHSKVSRSGSQYIVDRYASSHSQIKYERLAGGMVKGTITGAPIGSMELQYENGKTTITKINTDTGDALNNYTVDGKQYLLVRDTGTEYIIAEDYKDLYKISPDTMNNCVITNTITLKPDDLYSDQLQSLVDYWTERVEKLKEDLNKAFGGLENKFMDYFDVLFKRISENGWVYDEKVNNQSDKKASTNYLNTMLQNNKYYITEARELTGDAKYNYTMKIAEDVVKVYEIHDTNAENQALAEYETAKTMIATKEKKIDARMAKLETEQQVINTELDSIEKVRNDNIEKYFKIFA